MYIVFKRWFHFLLHYLFSYSTLPGKKCKLDQYICYLPVNQFSYSVKHHESHLVHKMGVSWESAQSKVKVQSVTPEREHKLTDAFSTCWQQSQQRSAAVHSRHQSILVWFQRTSSGWSYYCSLLKWKQEYKQVTDLKSKYSLPSPIFLKHRNPDI